MLEYEYDELPNTVDGLLHRMNQELTCPICLSLLNQSTSTPCGHIFCKQCILHSLTNLSKCPICKTSITKRALSDSESMEAVVREFQILRQHYERKTGNVLSQLPNKEYEEPQITDLSLLFPYPTKENNSSTQTIINKQQNKIESSIKNTEEVHNDADEEEEEEEEIEDNDDEEVDEDRQTLISAINKHQSHVAITSNISSNETKQDIFCATQDTTDSWTQDREQLQQQSLLLNIETGPSIPSTSSSNTMSISQLDPPPTFYLIYIDASVNDLTRSYLKKLESLQLLKTSTTMVSKITHFIMAADDQNNIIKINKTYLGAIILRKHIVHENWIKRCFEEKAMVDIKSYLVHNKPDRHKDGPQRARLSYLHGEPKLFYNKSFFFYPNSNEKTQSGIRFLINIGDGRIINDEKDIKKSTIILCTAEKNDDGKGKMKSIFHGKPLVKATWVTESVLRYQLLDVSDFYY